MSRGMGLSNGISVRAHDVVAGSVDKNDAAWCGMNDDADPELIPLTFPLRTVRYDIISSI